MTTLTMRAVAMILRRTAQPGMATAEKAREVMSRPAVHADPPRALRRRHRLVQDSSDGFDCWSVQPGSGPAKTAVLYLHGGGYIAGIHSAHWSLVRHVADAGHRVEVPFYGLAPRFTVEDAVPFVMARYRRLLDELGPGRVALAGDSAGGGLALAVAQQLRDGGHPAPAALGLVAPWLDLTLSNPAIATVDDPWLSAEGLREAGRAWAGSTSPRASVCSPVNGSVQGLPPIELFVGTRDLFHPDAEVLAVRCTEVGTTCRLHVEPGSVHVYPLTPTPEGRRGRRLLVSALDHHLRAA
ncbi:alpha/beta hydrolase [Arthrobacter sp. NEB 688]|uniref:alpha/beta hydrolase n=1 Tax=Arthrobacter sp. NEB 688 TaxID=904039 RepID=UPI001567A05B|nr:alpha/beta hydrolase [Arthrobacter sp. NEB 688]QKE84492.1 alpha/beta hydrolase [Arthrobacter sp. NEB 688]